MLVAAFLGRRRRSTPTCAFMPKYSKQPDAGNVRPHHHAEAVELISCSAVTPVGGLSALDGKQGWMKPGGSFGRTRYRMALDLSGWAAPRRVRASRSVPNCRGDCLGALSSAPDCNDKRGCEVCVHPEKRLARPCAEPLVTRLWIGAVNIGPLGQLWFSWRHCSFPGPSQSGFLGRLSSRKYWSGRQDLNLRPGQVALCPGCRRASIHGSVCASKPRPRNRFAAPGTAHSVRPPAG